MSNWDYHREERPKLEEGNYRVSVVNVEETISKSSGNPMLVIQIQPNESKIKINHYIVKNDYFNRNMTEFFDSFDVPEGNFNFLEWIGAVGAARLEYDENDYLKVRWFINKTKAEQLPPWKGEKPERNTVSTVDDFKEVEDNGMPWEE